jgi:hypothetical protein
VNENGQQPPLLEIEVQLAQAILDYLVGQPYREVAQLVARLSHLHPAGVSAAAQVPLALGEEE